MKAGVMPPQAGAQTVERGQLWERRNGTRVMIERIVPAATHEGFAEYYLAAGSRPQFRQIRIDRLLKTFKLLSPALPPEGGQTK
jgi:hypothetical protein